MTTICSCTIATEFAPVDPRDILAKHNVVYTSANVDDREPLGIVALTALPMYEDPLTRLYPVLIFSQAGGAIVRQRPVGGNGRCAVLINLHETRSKYRELQFAAVDEQYRTIQSVDKAKYSIYPTAGLQTLGGVQSKDGVTAIMQNAIALVLAKIRPENPGMDADCRLIFGICDNHYNNISHRMRSEPQLQVATRGDLTQVLAGSHSQDAKGKAKYLSKLTACDNGFPLDALYEQLAEAREGQERVNGDLRCETTFAFDVCDLDEDRRNGE